MAIRCVKCGGPVEGYSPRCESCNADKKAAEAAQYQAAVDATTHTCPSCGQNIPRASETCPNCNRDFSVKIRDWSFMQNVEFGRRFVAWFVDSILTGIIFSIAVASTENPFIAAGLSTAVGLAYNIGFLAFHDGQTPGKQLMRIRVMTTDHGNVDVVSAAIRYLVSSWLFVISQAFILFTDDHRALHDMAAGTVVSEADYREKLTQYRAENAQRQAELSRVTGRV